jgi:hypothetical protein
MKSRRSWKITDECDGDWSVEWYDGRGTYICSDFIRWWEIPYNIYRIWKESRE